MGQSGLRVAMIGFLAGVVGTLLFRQVFLLVLHKLVPLAPNSMRLAPPLGVPQFVSLAFWGGIWGWEPLWSIASANGEALALAFC